jgi:hypothetical protein
MDAFMVGSGDDSRLRLRLSLADEDGKTISERLEIGRASWAELYRNLAQASNDQGISKTAR